MAINQFPPRFRKGTEPIPAIASGTVAGGTFVKISADKDSDGNYVMAHCGLGERAAGVAEYDGDASLGGRFAVTPPPSVARVQPGGNITAGDEIVSDANGKAISRVNDVAAALDTGVVGSNNAITWTARAAGTGGNSLQVAIVNNGASKALTVDVNEAENKVTVQAATDGSSVITSTAQQVIDAVEANGDAARLFSVINKGASTGAGLVAAVAATNLAGGLDNDGTGHVCGVAQQSALSTDRFVEVALVSA